jgi:hypothetical protein
MTSGTGKICGIEDPDELRSALSEGGGDVSCAKCCATSNDADQLCDPVFEKGENLFCDPR